MRKRSHTQGLDQLGPSHIWGVCKQDFRHHSHEWKLSSKQASSLATRRHVKITLSDHLFSSDEIKTNDDT
jgi:hypothetical protein